MPTFVSRNQRVPALGAATLFALMVLPAAGSDGAARVGSMSIDELKAVYLGCEQSATADRLNAGDVMYCSLVYEELKEKAFAGDFLRIKSWLDRRSSPTG